MRLVRWALFALVACHVAPIDEPSEAAPEEYVVDEGWPALPPGKTLGRVLGVAVAPDGRVWVSHTASGGARNTEPIPDPTLAVIDPRTGALVAEHGAGMFRLPHALAFDADGRLWVTDADSHRIYVLDESGHIVRSLGAD